MFYVLLALRAELRARGASPPSAQPRLDALLDLVALGTVADVVQARRQQPPPGGAGPEAHPRRAHAAGVAALFPVAARDPRRAAAFDFGFALGPRINAAGRLSDMTLGIECLLTDDPARAAELAQAARRHQPRAARGRGRHARAGRGGAGAADAAQDSAPPSALSLFDPQFHEGVVGIVAGRLKDRLHRPTFVFARGADGLLKGSGRSIPGFHLRDALDLVAKRHPGLLRRFGGHAMAAGCTHGRRAISAHFDAAPAAGGQRVARRRHAEAHAAHRRAAGAGVVQRRDGGAARRAGLGPGLRGAGVLRRGARCCSSGWSAKST